MRGSTFLTAVASLLSLASKGLAGRHSDKIYGVNIGSWLLLEKWMLPEEWARMGGENCDDCSKCIATEYAFVQAYPDTADAIFDKHWATWFTKADVHKMQDLGINTVRIPLGYWLVEPLVDRETEFYPRGGMRRLKQGLRWLKDAGINVILDHHALPGVASANQMFAGRCTDDVQFYTPHNYHRALVWTAVMTAFSHLDPDFDSVYSIEAVNEPTMDANLTPGFGTFQKQFVQVIRAVEFVLGVDSSLEIDINLNLSLDFTSALTSICESAQLEAGVASALLEAVPVLKKMIHDYGDLSYFLLWHRPGRNALTTTFMDINWQYNNPANPADAKIGPQLYDNHLYYSFGGVAEANEQAYMESICNLRRVQVDAALGNSPLVFGEWGLSTQFATTEEFFHKWADAQKLAYSQGAGWIYWNFKVEESATTGDLGKSWSYFKGADLGYLTKDPSKYNNPDVCKPYINATLA